MSAPRLLFLYPAFCRSVQQSERTTQRAQARFRALHREQAAPFTTTSPRRRIHARPNQRYGTANEPPPHLVPRPEQPRTVSELKAGAEPAGKLTAEDEPKAKPETKAEATTDAAKESSNIIAAEKRLEESPVVGIASAPTEPDATAQPPSADDNKGKPVQGPSVPSVNPETVLHMPSPHQSAQEEQRKKPPHLQATPYVHHFDTFTMVGNLEQGGFKHEPAIELMKAMRLILAENLTLARDGLVSKSNVENETYLFRAACSELRTEVQNNRKGEMEKMRAQRIQLQHDVEILSQKMTQGILAMKDDLRGCFDDRKMNVKMEQRSMDSKIQGVNYKITVVLNSDARTDVEAVRWLLTRRAAFGLIIVAVSVLSVLKYTSYMTQLQEEERKGSTGKHGNDDQSPSSESGGPLGGNTSPGTLIPHAIGEAQELVSERDGRGYVSLG